MSRDFLMCDREVSVGQFRKAIISSGFVTQKLTVRSTKPLSQSSADETIFLAPSDFKVRENNEITDWSNISTFTVDAYVGAAKASLDFTDQANQDVVLKLEWVKLW